MKRFLFQKAENDDEALRGLLFSADEIAQIGDRLSALSSLKEVKALCADLRKNGKYFIYNDLSDNEFRMVCFSIFLWKWR